MSVFTAQTPTGSSGESGGAQATGPLAAWGVTTPRWALWSIGLLALVGLAILSEHWFPAAQPAAAPEKPAKPLSLSPQKTEHEAWMATAQGEIKQLEQTIQQLTKKQELMEQLLKDAKRPGSGLGLTVGPTLPGPGTSTSRPVLKTATDAAGLPAEPPPPMRESPPAEPRSSAVPKSPAPAPSPPAGGPASTPGPPLGGPLVTPVQAGKPVARETGAASGGKLRVIEADARAIPAKYWLPTGAIIPVRLLSGLDAPTGGAGASAIGGSGSAAGLASNPHPVLMEVIDLAKLPNETTMDATGCFALGEGMGDISTERAMIRVLGISCVKGDGVAVDLPLKGVVTGEDGKIGLRGRMVIRESAMLARALLTGFVSGISKAFMPFQMGFFVAPSAQQALQFPDPQQVGLAGLAGGMQQAANMLAQHYARMAARIYPVIEVDAGRWADLIVTEGRELKEPVR